ncbi:MAG: DNA circularization protein [Myxococcota bacterium]
MSWKDRLRRASFRGVPFYVDDVGTTQGRRTAVHRFPGREEVHVQDLGREATEFSVTAYVIGPDYDLERDALEQALLRGGPGKLVHPYRGERLVEVTGQVRTRESKAEGGMARISFPVTVVRPEKRRAVRRDTAAALGEDARALVTAARGDFTATFDASELPGSLQESSIDAIGDAADQLRGIHQNATAQLSTASELGTDLDDLTSASTTLVGTPDDLAGTMAGVMGSAFRAMAVPEAAARRQVELVLGALDSLGSFGDDYASIPTKTPSREQEATNRGALVQFVRTVAVAEAARTLAELPIPSFTEARRARRKVAEVLDQVMGEAGDRTYEAIARLRASIVAHLDQVARSLPELATYTPAVEMPALLLAHLLYGDARREAEIVERNDPSQPGLLDPAEPLEVLSA